jgi:hypothetical protein
VRLTGEGARTTLALSGSELAVQPRIGIVVQNQNESSYRRRHVPVLLSLKRSADECLGESNQDSRVAQNPPAVEWPGGF